MCEYEKVCFIVVFPFYRKNTVSITTPYEKRVVVKNSRGWGKSEEKPENRTNVLITNNLMR